MIYLFICILIIGTAMLLLNIRIKAVLGSEERWFFVGLGRSGVQVDSRSQQGILKVFGLTVFRFDIDKEQGKKEKKKPGKKQPSGKPAPARKQRQRSWQLAKEILPNCLKALKRYIIKILQALVVEELEAEVKAGFDSPALTGQVYGYYQAALGAVPAVFRRVRFTPDWTGTSLSGVVRLSVVLPFYIFLWRTIVLIWDLPLRKVYKLAIGTKKGA